MSVSHEEMVQIANKVTAQRKRLAKLKSYDAAVDLNKALRLHNEVKTDTIKLVVENDDESSV